MQSQVEPEERNLREAYLHSLARLSKSHLLVLRAASASLGWDFDEPSWEQFARQYDLPVASTFARASGGGSFRFAKFLAGVGPLPPHPGGPRMKKGQRIGGWTRDRLLLGAMTVARINGGWPQRNRFDEVARRARARGVEVPLLNAMRRELGVSYSELRRAATALARTIDENRLPDGEPPTYAEAERIAQGLSHAVTQLGYRPSADGWDIATRHLRSRGVCTQSTIHRTFGSWEAAWIHVESLGLDAGVQKDQRPRYTAERIAQGMALVETRLGYRPGAHEWTSAVRELKREVGPGVIPAKPTIYRQFSTWDEAWLAVDFLRARGDGETAGAD